MIMPGSRGYHGLILGRLGFLGDLSRTGYAYALNQLRGPHAPDFPVYSPLLSACTGPLGRKTGATRRSGGASHRTFQLHSTSPVSRLYVQV